MGSWLVKGQIQSCVEALTVLVFVLLGWKVCSICGGLVLVLRVSVGLSCSGLVYTDGGLLSSESWLGGVLSNVFGVRSESVMVDWLSFWAECMLWCIFSSVVCMFLPGTKADLS